MTTPARRRIDWGPLKERYVEGVVDDKGERTWPKLVEVAEFFGVNPTRVREKSAQEGWVEARASFQAHMEKVRQNKRAADLAKEATELDGRALTGAKMGIQLINARLGEIAKAMGEQAQKRKELDRRRANGLPTEGLEDEVELMGSPIEAKEMAMLAQAAEGWHRLGQRALGDVDSTVRHEISGPGGDAVEVRQTIRGELTRDDPRRLQGVLLSLERAGVLGSLVQGRLGAAPAALTHGSGEPDEDAPG